MWANHDVSSNGTPGPCDPALIGCTATPNYSTLSAIGSTFSVPVDLKGFIGGGQIGYNWQFANWVAGLETDLQGIAHHEESGSFFTVVPQPAFPAFPLASAATVSRSLDYLGTVRGRLGWTPAGNWLRYGTGGLA
jgi:outer membrane immunogenic protein